MLRRGTLQWAKGGNSYLTCAAERQQLTEKRHFQSQQSAPACKSKVVSQGQDVRKTRAWDNKWVRFHEDNTVEMIKGLAYLQILLRHLDNLPWLEERVRDYRMKIQSKSPLNDTCQDWALVWITFGHLQSFLRDGAITSNEIVGAEKERRSKKKRLLSYN